MTRIRTFMGRKQIRASMPSAASQRALSAAFAADMEEIIQGLVEFADHMDGMSADILVEALEPTFGKALEYCPQDSGELRASGYLEARRFHKGAEVELGFGRGGKPDYAIYVHEIPAAHESPTRDKWLQAALDEDYYSILNSLPALVRQAAGT